MDEGILPITTGFIGATPEGVVTTLGRGGSDYSAAIIGAVLPADEVWIWTDVDGVMTTDPRIESSARTLPEITYSEIAELAYFGAKVLHPKTIRPVIEAGIGLRICNTFNPSHPGTRLIANTKSYGQPVNGKVIKAVTAIRKQRLVTVEGRGMLGVPGVAARTFAAVASTGTSVPLITQASSEQSICFAVPTETAEPVVHKLENIFSSEIEDNDIDRVWMTEDVSIITIVGVGMIHTPGVAGQVFSQLGKNNVNVLAIAQGSSEVSISMVVAAADTENAVKALHQINCFINQEGVISCPKFPLQYSARPARLASDLSRCLITIRGFTVVALAASDRSVRQPYAQACRWILNDPMPEYARNMVVVPATTEAVNAKIVFSALPADLAKDLEPQFAQAGFAVCSNASSYRRADDVPLLLPEVNADHVQLVKQQREQRGWSGCITTNPNCTSTGLNCCAQSPR